MMQNLKEEFTETKTQWAVVSSYGSRIRMAGEMLEFCEAPLDDFEEELASVEKAAQKIREQIAFIRGRPLPGLPTWKLNREMYREAVKACLSRDLHPDDLPRELELEIFGSESDE